MHVAKASFTERTVWQAYEQMCKNPDGANDSDESLFMAAYSLSTSISVAGPFIPKMFASMASCSVFDNYDIYTRFGMRIERCNNDIQLAKRVLLLPAPDRKVFLEVDRHESQKQLLHEGA